MIKNIDCSKEIWKTIEDYEGLYEVSNWGRIKSLPKQVSSFDRGKPIKVYKGETLMHPSTIHGYKNICLKKNGVPTRFLVHRLVAKAFIPNPNNYPIINHKDENPANNRADNLEWCTHRYNVNYGTAIQRAKETKQRKQDIQDRIYENSYEERKVYAEYLNKGSLYKKTPFWTAEMICFVPDDIRDKLFK